MELNDSSKCMGKMIDEIDEKTENLWDNLMTDIDSVGKMRDKILRELSLDPEDTTNNANGFRNMYRNYQNILIREYKKILDDKPTKSETFKGLVEQNENPKDMTLTKKWWNSESKYGEAQDICEKIFSDDPGKSNDLLNDISKLNWGKLDDEIKWKIHEYRMEQLGISLNTKKVKTEKPVIEKPKEYKVECWHCGDKDQTLDLNNDQAFECSVCKELLWRGNGGFVEVEGIYC